MALNFVNNMKVINYLNKYFIFLRWSYTVPLLCYIVFFITIWMLAVPLKPIKIQKEINLQPEDTFEIRIKNSNFNSDGINNENNNQILYEKNEYLINTNSIENNHKDKTEILQEVFTK